MSTSIRLVISPTQRRLHNLLQLWSSFPQPILSVPQTDQITELQQQIFNLSELRLRIVTATNLLEQQHANWAKYIATLSGSELAAEEKVLNDFNKPTSDGILGFIDLMLEAKDQTAIIDIRLQEWHHSLGTIEKALSLESTVSTPTEKSSHLTLTKRGEDIPGDMTLTKPGLSNPLTLTTGSDILDSLTALTLTTTQGISVPQTSTSTSQYGQGGTTTAIGFQTDRTGMTFSNQTDHLTSMTFKPQCPSRQLTQQAVTPVVKLPKLEMPEFNGEDETKWLSFWQSFESQIHNRTDLSDIDKFRFLKRALKGRAGDVITGIQETNSNYLTAIQSLQERYGDLRSIIQLLYSQLENIPKSGPSVTELQLTCDNTEKILRQLENLEQDIHNYILVNLVKNKFPSILLELEQVKGNSDLWTMTELRKCLKHVIGLRKRAFCEVSCRSTTNIDYEFNVTARTSVPEKYNNFERPDLPISPCVFCEGEHFHAECPVYKTVEEREQRLAELQLCPFCLGEYHSGNVCPKQGAIVCKRCNSHAHRTYLCSKGEPNLSQSQPNKSTKNSAITCTTVSGSTKSVLLTAKCCVSNPINNNRNVAKVFFDCGSQTTYVSSKFVKKFDFLVQEENKTLELRTFGTTEVMTIPSRKTAFSLYLQSGKQMKIEANVVPIVTGTLFREAIHENDMEFLANFPPQYLADSVPKTLEGFEPDILLGNDYCWKIISGGENQIILPSGLQLIPSKIGFLLGGKSNNTQQSKEKISCIEERTRNEKYKNTMEKHKMGEADEIPDTKLNHAGERHQSCDNSLNVQEKLISNAVAFCGPLSRGNAATMLITHNLCSLKEKSNRGQNSKILNDFEQNAIITGKVVTRKQPTNTPAKIKKGIG